VEEEKDEQAERDRVNEQGLPEKGQGHSDDDDGVGIGIILLDN
jgi:hypothetical protein